MIRTTAVVVALLIAGAAQAQTFGPDSTFQDMMANPKARAILDANIPLVMTVFDGGSGQPETATLKSVSENEQARTLGDFTPQAYAKILAEFRALSGASSPPARARFGPDSTFAQLVADPKARAILDRHVPMVMAAFDMELFPGTAPLKEVAANEAAQSQANFTADAYKAILEDLSKL